MSSRYIYFFLKLLFLFISTDAVSAEMLNLHCTATAPDGVSLIENVGIDLERKTVILETNISRKGVVQKSKEKYVDGHVGSVLESFAITSDNPGEQPHFDEMNRKFFSMMSGLKLSQHVEINEDLIKFGADLLGRNPRSFSIDRTTGEMKVDQEESGPTLKCTRRERKF